MRNDNHPKPLLKCKLSQPDHDLVRLASAIQRTSMAEFARTTLVREAKRVMADVSLPAYLQEANSQNSN